MRASASDFKDWRTIALQAVDHPRNTLTLLGIQFLVVLLSYIGKTEFGDALLIAALFTVLWVVIFLGLPALAELLVGLLVLIVVGGLAYFIFQNFGLEGIIGLIVAGVIALVVFGLVVILIQVIFYLAPGFLVGSAVYELTGENLFLAAVATIVVTIVLAAVIHFIFNYLLPFLIAFTWGYVSLGLANQLSVAIIVGTRLFEVARMPRPSFTLGFIGSLLVELLDLVRSILAMPGLLTLWAFIVSAYVAFRVVHPMHVRRLQDELARLGRSSE